MRRRICLALGLVALGAPASGWAQSSSQAQYQGVAPETQIPVTGGGSSAGGGGAAATAGTSASGNSAGGQATSGGKGSSQATGGGRPASGTTGAGTSHTSGPAVALPTATSSTSPFGGSDILWIVIAAAGLTGLGLLLRRSTRRTPAV